MSAETFVLHLKGELEQVGAILGVLTTLFATSKKIASTITDHTLARRKRTAAEAVNANLEALRKFADLAAGFAKDQDAEKLGVYHQDLQDNLSESLEALQSAREKIALHEARRLQEPGQFAKWFILYRPLNFDGLLTQACFFELLLLTTITAARWVHRPASIGDPVGAALGALLFSVYLSGVADRLRSVFAAATKNGISPRIESDWSKRNLLWFHPENADAWLDRLIYYSAGFLVVVILVAFTLVIREIDFRDSLRNGAIFLLAAILMRVSRADALAIRAEASLPAPIAPHKS
jgi:hypothetical protein